MLENTTDHQIDQRASKCRCTKIKHLTQASAHTHLTQLVDSGESDLNVYPCPDVFGIWHVGHPASASTYSLNSTMFRSNGRLPVMVTCKSCGRRFEKSQQRGKARRRFCETCKPSRQLRPQAQRRDLRAEEVSQVVIPLDMVLAQVSQRLDAEMRSNKQQIVELERQANESAAALTLLMARQHSLQTKLSALAVTDEQAAHGQPA